jgi:hypothetical protein
MKLTKRKLKQIIKEELRSVLFEYRKVHRKEPPPGCTRDEYGYGTCPVETAISELEDFLDRKFSLGRPKRYSITIASKEGLSYYKEVKQFIEHLRINAGDPPLKSGALDAMIRLEQMVNRWNPTQEDGVKIKQEFEWALEEWISEFEEDRDVP